MSIVVVVSSDKDKQQSTNMGPEVQRQALLWVRTRLDNASENDIPASRPKDEQREAGEAMDDLREPGTRARALYLAGDLKEKGLLGDMVAEWGDLDGGT